LNLRPLPDQFAATRDALHQVAFFVLGPARYAAVGRMGLQAAPGGFGTPEFGGRIARVEGDSIVLEESDVIATQSVTTVGAAVEFVGIEYDEDWYEGFRDPLPPVGPETPLRVDDTAARALGQWFNFGFDILSEFRSRATRDDAASEVQLWPEHFDPATEIGSEAAGERASYGASPGDGAHDEPYVYVGAWGDIDRDNGYWNDHAFEGASLGYSELVTGGDPKERALDFLLEGYRILHSP